MNLSESSELSLRTFLDSLPKQDKPILFDEDHVKTVYIHVDVQNDFTMPECINAQPDFTRSIWPNHAVANIPNLDPKIFQKQAIEDADFEEIK